VRRNCSPSGWPTAEFTSVSAGKACPTSEKGDSRNFATPWNAQVGFSQVGSLEVGLYEFGTLEVGSEEVGSGEVG
jgi:hypothetical protein